MTIMNVCTTEDVQNSWGVFSITDLYCIPARVLRDGIFGFNFVSVESQVKGLASPPDPRQNPSDPYPVLSRGSQFPSPEPIATLP